MRREERCIPSGVEGVWGWVRADSGCGCFGRRRVDVEILTVLRSAVEGKDGSCEGGPSGSFGTVAGSDPRLSFRFQGI